MKRITKILILVVAAVLMTSLFMSCKKDKGDDSGGQTVNPLGSSIFEVSDIKTAAQNGLNRAYYDTSGISTHAVLPKRFVDSEYEILFNKANLTITYQANYTASSEEDSLIDKDAEILLRIKDNNDINNKLFVYYNGNDLYTEVNGVRSYQKNFSAEPTYELFYSIITTFDVGQFYFFNRNWESVDDPWAVDEANGNKLSSFYEYYAGIINGVDFNTISVTAVQEKNADGSNKKLADITSPYAITIANATLDNGKTAINKILTGTVRDYIGKRLDALTLLGFGFKLSDIGNAGIGRLDCEEASMSFIPRATDGQAKVNAILLDFSGNEANNVDRFKIHIYYEEKPLGDLDKGTIGITQYDVNKNYAVNERLAGTYEKADLTVANYFNTPKKLSEAPIEGTLLYNALANAVRNNESPRTILSTLMPVSSISKDTIARLRDEGKLINETDIFLDEDGNIPSWAVNAILLRSGTARTNDGKTVDMRFCEDETILELVQKGEVIYKYNDYRISFGGEYSYTGTLYVDAWEAEFSAAIRAVIDPKNENRDQFLIDFRSKSPDFVVADGGSEFDTFHDDQVAFLYYNYKPEGTPDGDKKLYINIEGLVANYLGEPGLDGNPPKSPFAFGEMNLPKAYTDGFDFHKFVNSVLSNASTIVLIRNNMFNTAFNQGSAESTSYLFNIVRSEPTLYALVDSIIMHSQSNGTKFSFTIDKDLLKAIENLQNTAQELLNQTNNNAIEAANYVKYVAEFISETIGLDVGAVNALIESGIFDEIHLVLSYDFSDSLITVETFNGTTRFFILSLYEDSQNEQMLNITPPKYFSKDLYDYVEFDSAEYERYAPAEVLRLHFEGEMGVQGDVPADMSELLGIFLGDGTGANSEFIIRGGDRMYLETEIWQDNGETMLFLSLWYNPVLLPGSYGKIQYTRADIDNAATPPILRVYSAEDDHECFYVEIADAYFRKKADLALGESLIPLSYKINRQSVYDALQISLGDASLFSTNAIADIYSVLQRDARTAITGEYMSLSLSPYEVNGRIYDPILSIFGVENINANMRAKVFFSRPEIIQTVAANYTEPFEFDKASYAEPVIDSLEDMAFKSKYTAYFAKDIEVYFGDLTLEYKLSFVGRTAEFSTDIYRYKPEAYLFGQTATYSMIITDTANGTRDLTGVASRYAVYKDGVFDGTYAYELDSIVIDPLDDVPIPTFIAVYYDLPSGQRIYDTLEFIIQGFPYTNATVKAKLDGEAPNAYTIKIGKGSVSEIDFVVNIEIKNRRIQLVNESLEGQAYADALAKSYINGIPIIEHLTIDPVEFSQRRITDPTYDPLAFYRESPRVEETRIISGVPTVVVTSSLIQFMSTSGELRENVYIGTRSGEWNEPTHVTESFSTTEEYGIFDFDLSNISYNGGRFYVYAKWKSLKMAIEINVAARVVDYIKIE
ncbi:MAG: hypothetical protein LBN25_03935, partial [Christensenellaceae bacterium]|nr:hypothetical protein [Christensenellaceae bacterium]